MKLQGENGTDFELAVLRYEHADYTEDFWDANWLVVKGSVSATEGSWHFLDPCATTFELAGLANWLDTIAVKGFEPSEYTFAEPNLVFSCGNDPQPSVTIRFTHESAPGWIWDVEERIAGVALCFPMSPDTARDAAAQLRTILVDFPIRGGAA
jgi:hypothetical protein